MKQIYVLVVLFLSTLVLGCSADSDTPISLQIPFGGALTSQSRVVVVDGASLSGGSPIGALRTKSQQAGGRFFSCEDPQGNRIGSVEYGEGMIRESLEDGEQSSFTMPVCFRLDGEQEVCADRMRFAEFLHQDPTFDCCAELPRGVTCQDVRIVGGAAAGTITSAVGSCRSAVGQNTIEHRYAMCVTGKGVHRKAIRNIHSIVLLNGCLR